MRVNKKQSLYESFINKLDEQQIDNQKAQNFLRTYRTIYGDLPVIDDNGTLWVDNIRLAGSGQNKGIELKLRPNNIMEIYNEEWGLTYDGNKISDVDDMSQYWFSSDFENNEEFRNKITSAVKKLYKDAIALRDSSLNESNLKENKNQDFLNYLDLDNAAMRYAGITGDYMTLDQYDKYQEYIHNARKNDTSRYEITISYWDRDGYPKEKTYVGRSVKEIAKKFVASKEKYDFNELEDWSDNLGELESKTYCSGVEDYLETIARGEEPEMMKESVSHKILEQANGVHGIDDIKRIINECGVSVKKQNRKGRDYYISGLYTVEVNEHFNNIVLESYDLPIYFIVHTIKEGEGRDTRIVAYQIDMNCLDGVKKITDNISVYAGDFINAVTSKINDALNEYSTKWTSGIITAINENIDSVDKPEVWSKENNLYTEVALSKFIAIVRDFIDKKEYAPTNVKAHLEDNPDYTDKAYNESVKLKESADSYYMIGEIKNIDGVDYYVGDSTDQGFVFKDEEAYKNRPDDVCYIAEVMFTDKEYSTANEEGNIPVKSIKSNLDKQTDDGGVSTKNSIMKEVRALLEGDKYYYEKPDGTRIEAKDFDDKLIEEIADDIFDTVDWQCTSSYLNERDWDDAVEDYYDKKFGFDSLDEGCRVKSNKKKKLTESEKLIWSSDVYDDYADWSDEDFMSEYEASMGEEAESLEQAQEFFLDSDAAWDVKQEDLEFNIIPEIQKQTTDNIIFMSGSVGLWTGNHAGGKTITLDKPEDLLDYDVDTIRLVEDSDGGILWKGYHHDGTHVMKLYGLPKEEEARKKLVQDLGIVDWYKDMYSYDNPDEEALQDALNDLYSGSRLNDILVPDDYAKIPELCPMIKWN